MIALQKLWKMFFILSKKLFSFSRYSNFCNFVFCSFFPVSHCLKSWSKKNLKIYVMNCRNKNLITLFAWYLEKEIRCDIETLSIDRELNKELFLWQNHAENVHQNLVPGPFLILLNNPKQPLLARNPFKNKVRWKKIIKKP